MPYVLYVALALFSVNNTDVGVQQVVKTLLIHSVVKYSVLPIVYMFLALIRYIYIYKFFLKRPTNALGYVNVSLLY